MTTRRYIALLRGINVGRAKRIAMADLRRLVAKLGFSHVRSLLSSGNVVFSAAPLASAAAAQAIEEALVLRLGVAARVTVMTSDELNAVVAANPLLPVAADPARLLAFIVKEAGALGALAPLAGQDWGEEALAVGPRAAYVWCPQGVLACKAAEAVGKLLGDSVTARNWSTLMRLQQLCAEAVDA